MSSVKPIPDGFHSVTPHLVIRDAAKALGFYQKAFGAEELFRMPGPGGVIMHAEVMIGDSIVMIGEENLEMGSRSPQTIGGSPINLHVYVKDVDAAFTRAQSAGCKVHMPPTDMFWGDRYGRLEDPFGHQWSLATHKEDVSPEEMSKRMAAMA